MTTTSGGGIVYPPFEFSDFGFELFRIWVYVCPCLGLIFVIVSAVRRCLRMKHEEANFYSQLNPVMGGNDAEFYSRPTLFEKLWACFKLGSWLLSKGTGMYYMIIGKTFQIILSTGFQEVGPTFIFILMVVECCFACRFYDQKTFFPDAISNPISVLRRDLKLADRYRENTFPLELKFLIVFLYTNSLATGTVNFLNGFCGQNFDMWPAFSFVISFPTFCKQIFISYVFYFEAIAFMFCLFSSQEDSPWAFRCRSTAGNFNYELWTAFYEQW